MYFKRGCILLLFLVFGFFTNVSSVPGNLVYEEAPIRQVGLYAGITDINFETYYVDTEKVETYEIKSSLYVDEDYEQLAHLIYAEAGSQGDTCMLYVGSIILNRVNSSRYPNTIKDVINQKGQYSVRKWYMKRTPSEDAYASAGYLLTYGSQLPYYVLYQHGKNKAVAGTITYTKVNGEVFSYEERDK